MEKKHIMVCTTTLGFVDITEEPVFICIALLHNV